MPSTLFPIDFPDQSDVGIYDFIPKGFDEPVHLYISDETVKKARLISCFNRSEKSNHNIFLYLDAQMKGRLFYTKVVYQ